MQDSTALYPAGPSSVPESAIKPGKKFRSEVSKVLGSIFLFFLVYVLLMLFALALAAVCIYAGIMVIGALTSFLGIIAGLGIISVGIMVLFFLIKFIFSVKKFDTSTSIELEESAQPELFAFIRQLTKDTQTPFPRKIMLSPEVNACVFYNDSFWSMLFPVRKNLQIGLALVNTLTISEFKAVMAHEFGHFSQRSMKLGSFVYNVNKVIYNMLYENNSFGRFLEGYSQLHWAISFFMTITVTIIKGIQQILQQMYSLVNKRYMALSREMEFHADAVAASVSGSSELINALRKIEMSSGFFQVVITEANELASVKNKVSNLYDAHDSIMERYAEEHGLPRQNGVPVPTEKSLHSMNASRIVIKNQWASHPEREDREKHLEELAIEATADDRSSWLLFKDKDLLQKQMTGIAYKALEDQDQFTEIDRVAFAASFDEKAETYKLPDSFRGYYDDRKMAALDIDMMFANVAAVGDTSRQMFSQLFDEEAAALPVRVANTKQDVQILEAIVQKRIDLKTFDFDGSKYKRSEAATILNGLNQELTTLQSELDTADQERMIFFAGAAKAIGEQQFIQLRERCESYFELRRKEDEYFQASQRVINIMAPLLSGQRLDLSDAQRIASRLKEQSAILRPLLVEWREKGVFTDYPELDESVKTFVEATFEYFAEDSFFNTELSQLHFIVVESTNKVSRYLFRTFKEMMTLGLSFVNPVPAPEAVGS